MIGAGRRTDNKATATFDKDCFESWLETGSLVETTYKLRAEGKNAKANGVPYSVGGVRFAALRHYIRNYPETRRQVEESYTSRGFFPATENLDISTINYAFSQFGRNNDVVEWLKTQGLYEMYKDYINEKISKLKSYKERPK